MARPSPFLQAGEELAAREPIVARLVGAVGPPDVRPPRRTSFEALARAICFQQVSGRAAATIYGRFETAVGGRVTPDAVLSTPLDELRGAGLSGAKAASVIDLAAKVADGTVPLARLGRLGDEELIERLVVVRGIGRWTAEMFLIFQLRRLDVWPIDDLGVRKGYAVAWGLPAMPSPKELAVLGEPLRPLPQRGRLVLLARDRAHRPQGPPKNNLSGRRPDGGRAKAKRVTAAQVVLS